MSEISPTTASSVVAMQKVAMNRARSGRVTLIHPLSCSEKDRPTTIERFLAYWKFPFGIGITMLGHRAVRPSAHGAASELKTASPGLPSGRESHSDFSSPFIRTWVCLKRPAVRRASIASCNYSRPKRWAGVRPLSETCARFGGYDQVIRVVTIR
jgi:hypothetical protein